MNSVRCGVPVHFFSSLFFRTAHLRPTERKLKLLLFFQKNLFKKKRRDLLSARTPFRPRGVRGLTISRA